MTVDIVITSFNGRRLLKKHLPAVIENSPKINQIIIIDDAGTDDTSVFLKNFYPQIKYLKNPKNLGFTRSTNRGVAASTADFVVLLNNDISPQKDYLKHALKYFKDDHLFAVTFAEENASWPQVSWDGKLQYIQSPQKTKPHYSAWASGGSCLVRRSIWVKLGGFNPIYSPGYWEDIDLGWRAWKQDYRIIWAPDAQVLHQHESTFKKLNQKYISLIKQRNELFFNWLNITDKDLSLAHYKYLVGYTLRHPGYLKVIAFALLKYPRLITSRIKHHRLAVKTDRQILTFLSGSAPKRS